MKFDAFAALVSAVAEDQHKKSIVEGLKASGPAYSLTDDITNKNLDSLDVTETIMSLEEKLQATPGFENVKLEGDEFEAATNMGQLYAYVCKSAGVTPVLPETINV